MAKSKGIMPKYAPRPKGGRNPELTPEIQNIIIECLEQGNYLETAAAMAGVHKSTVFGWLRKGRDPDNIEPSYKAFVVSVDKAQARVEVNLLARLDRAAQLGAWQADTWRLERKFPDRWGRRERVEHTGKDGGPITFKDYMSNLEKEVAEEDAESEQN
jgi:hypothetical protein